MILTFNKNANLDKLRNELLNSGFSAVLYKIGSSLSLEFSQELSESDQAVVTAIVDVHIPKTSAENLEEYLSQSVFPFVSKLVCEFAAENISNGITQAEKTADILGMFSKKRILLNLQFPVSLKDAFDTGSLYVAKDIIQNIRDNPAEFDGLSPFVTDAKLLQIKNKIESFLGIPLSS